MEREHKNGAELCHELFNEINHLPNREFRTAFLAQIPREHRAVQQDVFAFILDILDKYAEMYEDKKCDDRNIRACVEAYLLILYTESNEFRQKARELMAKANMQR